MEFFPIWAQILLWVVLIVSLFAVGIIPFLAFIALKILVFIFDIFRRLILQERL